MPQKEGDVFAEVKTGIDRANMFKFTQNRKPYPKLLKKRNIYNDNRHKKTYQGVFI